MRAVDRVLGVEDERAIVGGGDHPDERGAAGGPSVASTAPVRSSATISELADVISA